MVGVMRDGLNSGLKPALRGGVSPGIRISSELRKFRRRDVEPQPMASLEHGGCVTEFEVVFIWRVRLGHARRRFRAVSKPRAHDPIEDVIREPAWLDVNQLDGEVGVARGRLRPQGHGDRTNDGQIAR